jgi:hypothetical protein
LIGSRRRRKPLGQCAFHLLIALLASVSGVAGATEPEYDVSGHLLRGDRGALAGGRFVLSGAAPHPISPRGGALAVTQATRPAAQLSPAGALCFCGAPLFADGFESGNTAAWSAVDP